MKTKVSIKRTIDHYIREHVNGDALMLDNLFIDLGYHVARGRGDNSDGSWKYRLNLIKKKVFDIINSRRIKYIVYEGQELRDFDAETKILKFCDKFYKNNCWERHFI